MWKVEPLGGKYYGTRVSNGDRFIDIWTGFDKYTPEEVSVREKAQGWGEDGDYYFDHVESQFDYDTAVQIAEMLNKKENVNESTKIG